MGLRKLDRIFNPDTIAVIGASDTEGKVGYSLMSNLISNGFKGTIYPVNIKRKSVQGVKAYPSITEVPDKIDLAIIVTPAKTVPAITEECGKKGVIGLIIISAGFKEAGDEGNRLFSQVISISKKYNMRIIGPNCLGFMRPKKRLNASFANKMALPGRIAFISQSGALGTAILDWSVKQNIGFSYFVSIGSMADIGFNDLIDYFGTDPDTNSILIYMESMDNAKRFISAARAFARNKPIVVLKVGRSAEGSRAAMSHTGSLTGNDAVFDAAFKRAGVLRVNTIGELFDAAKTLSAQERPTGKRLAIITNAGGPGVIATDYLIENGGEIAKLSKETIEKLSKFLPEDWSHANPVDILGDATPEQYRKALEIVMEDNNADGILIILTPQAMTNPSEVARQISDMSNRSRKAIFTSWMGEHDIREGREIFKKAGIPTYKIPETAVRCFLNMYMYSRNQELLYETPASIPHAFEPKTKKNKELIHNIMDTGRFTLTEKESKELLANYGIPISKSSTAKTKEEAAKMSKKIGYPVAMKILSPDIMHKTDVGGVELYIENDADARKAFQKIVSSAKKKAPKAKIDGVLIEKMEQKRYELIIGGKKDQIFGPVIIFGMGGVAVEVFKDTTIGLPPLNMALAMRMIKETKIYQLLKGYRGMKGVDITSIQFLLYKFAYLLMDFPEIKEIDINPFGVDEKGGVVLDAKIALDESLKDRKIEPYSHMVISPYPKEYIKKIAMRNGKPALFRPIKPEDEEMEAEMFRQMSDETQRYRFFQTIKNITHDTLVRYTQIDYDREIAIIAEVSEGKEKKMAGVARLVADPYNLNAEFAIVVADPWQKQGIGGKLTDFIVDIAKKRKIRKIYIELLPDNQRIIDMFRHRGFSMVKHQKIIGAEVEL